MMKMILAAALAILPAAARAATTCPGTGTGLNLQVCPLGADGTSWAQAMRNNFNKISTGAFISSSTSPGDLASLRVGQILGLPTGSGIWISSPTTQTSSGTFSAALGIPWINTAITFSSTATFLGAAGLPWVNVPITFTSSASFIGAGGIGITYGLSAATGVFSGQLSGASLTVASATVNGTMHTTGPLTVAGASSMTVTGDGGVLGKLGVGKIAPQYGMLDVEAPAATRIMYGSAGSNAEAIRLYGGYNSDAGLNACIGDSGGNCDFALRGDGHLFHTGGMTEVGTMTVTSDVLVKGILRSGSDASNAVQVYHQSGVGRVNTPGYSTPLYLDASELLLGNASNARVTISSVAYSDKDFCITGKCLSQMSAGGDVMAAGGNNFTGNNSFATGSFTVSTNVLTGGASGGLILISSFSYITPGTAFGTVKGACQSTVTWSAPEAGYYRFEVNGSVKVHNNAGTPEIRFLVDGAYVGQYTYSLALAAHYLDSGGVPQVMSVRSAPFSVSAGAHSACIGGYDGIGTGNTWGIAGTGNGASIVSYGVERVP